MIDFDDKITKSIFFQYLIIFSSIHLKFNLLYLQDGDSIYYLFLTKFDDILLLDLSLTSECGLTSSPPL